MRSVATALVLIAVGAGGPEWRPLEAGIEVAAVDRAGVALQAVRLEPWLVRGRVVLASELGQAAATAREFAQATGALVVVNGGFFDPELRPIGVRMSGGRRTAGSVRKNLGALVEAGGRFDVVMGADLDAMADLGEVVQCGPRLVVDGAPNRLKPQIARRTVAAVDRAGRLVLLVTSRGQIDAGALAAWLAEPEERGGFGLVTALNLDGGSSSQMYLCAGDLEIDVRGLTPVSDAIVVVRPGVRPGG